MRDWGRRKAVDQCLEKYGVNVILGPGDCRINEFTSAAGKQSQYNCKCDVMLNIGLVGYPEAVLPLSYLDLNGRPFGLAAIASAHQEALLIQLMSAWEQHFNTERKLPTWLAGDPRGGKTEL